MPWVVITEYSQHKWHNPYPTQWNILSTSRKQQPWLRHPRRDIGRKDPCSNTTKIPSESIFVPLAATSAPRVRPGNSEIISSLGMTTTTVASPASRAPLLFFPPYLLPQISLYHLPTLHSNNNLHKSITWKF